VVARRFSARIILEDDIVKRFDRMRLAGELAGVLYATLAGDVARLPGVR
jgi:hypothetical protein